MSSMQTRLGDLAIRVATECKSLRMLVNGNAGDLTSLSTGAKANLVAAINELKAAIDGLPAGLQINDSATLSGATWSSTKISAQLTALENRITNGVSAELDTLAEFAAAIGNDKDFAAHTVTSLGNRLRFDAPQALNGPQITQACANLGLGEPNTDFVGVFVAGLA
jgi:hypothetical protein